MSVIYADGFAKYGLSNTFLAKMFATSSINQYNTPLRSRGAIVGLNSGTIALGCQLRYVFQDGVGRDVVGMACGFFINGLPTLADGGARHYIAVWRDGANAQMCALEVSTTGTLRVHSSVYGVIAESAPCITAGGWNHVEAWASFAGASGAMEVRVNEVAVIGGASAVSGAMLDLGAAGTCKQMSLFKEAGNTGVSEIYWADLVYMDDLGDDPVDFIGDCSCLDQMPDGNTAQDDFLKSTGSSAFAIVDDTPPDADYIQGVSAGDRTELTLPTFVEGNIAAVVGVVLFTLLKKHSAGSGTYQQGLESGGDEFLGAVISPGTTTAYYTDPNSINPDTGVKYTVNEIENALSTFNKVS